MVCGSHSNGLCGFHLIPEPTYSSKFFPPCLPTSTQAKISWSPFQHLFSWKCLSRLLCCGQLERTGLCCFEAFIVCEGASSSGNVEWRFPLILFWPLPNTACFFLKPISATESSFTWLLPTLLENGPSQLLVFLTSLPQDHFVLLLFYYLRNDDR